MHTAIESWPLIAEINGIDHRAVVCRVLGLSVSVELVASAISLTFSAC